MWVELHTRVADRSLGAPALAGPMCTVTVSHAMQLQSYCAGPRKRSQNYSQYGQLFLKMTEKVLPVMLLEQYFHVLHINKSWHCQHNNIIT